MLHALHATIVFSDFLRAESPPEMTGRRRDAAIKSLYEYGLERDDFRLLAQWDKERNGDLTPRSVSYGSRKKVWWRCDAGHRWEAPVYSRTGSGSGCPYCAGKRVAAGVPTLASEYPELAKQWHPTKNLDLTPDRVSPGTHRKAWWLCEKGHEWQAEIKSRASGTGCPICTNRKVAAGENDLATTHPGIAAQWHPTKNGSLTPEEVVAGAQKRVWWQCEKGHEWQAEVWSRTVNHAGCPVCAGKQVCAGFNDLATTFPDLAAQWHPTKNGAMTPQSVTPFSNRRAWWICDLGHVYQASIADRASLSSGCPYCAGRKVLAGFNDLATKEPLVAAQWHPTLNGELTPRDVTAGSRKRIWWQCREGHVWKAVVYSRAGPQKADCPVCAGRTNRAHERRYAAMAAKVSNNGSAVFDR